MFLIGRINIGEYAEMINMPLVLSISMGVIAIAVSFLIWVFIDSTRMKRFNYLNSMNSKYAVIKRKLKARFRSSVKKNKSIVLNNKEKYLVIAFALLLVTTSNNFKNMPMFMSLGAITGLGVVVLMQNVKSKNLHRKKVEEIAIVFEAIELYMKAGYSMYQAIRASRLLVKTIRPALDTCLTYWGAGPKVALGKLQDELSLPEAETLILLMINLESTGSQEMQNAIGGEVFSMESIERMKRDIEISNKPLVLMIYRMLPLVSVLGIVVGSLVYRTFAVLEISGISLF